MGCNCGGGRRERRAYRPAPTATRAHVLVMPNGQRIRFGSKLEADAANVRANYRGRVEPA